MKAETIIERVTADGLGLSVSHDGKIRITGDQKTVDSWLETIRENKAAILSELSSEVKVKSQHITVIPPVTVTGSALKPAPVLESPKKISTDLNEADRKYSVVVTDASTDPVLVKVAIKGIGSFDLEIPLAHYDGLALLEVLEQHSVECRTVHQSSQEF